MTLRLIVDLQTPAVSWDVLDAEECRVGVQRACEHSLDLLREGVTVASVRFDPEQPIPFD